jgi:hypothetical protein
MRKSLALLALALITTLPLMPLGAQNGPSLQEQLEAQYPYSSVISIGGCKASNPETALVTNRAGIVAVPASSFAPKCDSRYEGNGRIKPPGEVCTGNVTSKMGGWLSKVKPTVPNGGNVPKHELISLDQGATVYPLKIEVIKEGVKFTLGYCQQLQDGSSSYYKGEVLFPFSADVLNTAHVSQIEDKIAEIVSPPSNDQQSADAGGQNGGQQQEAAPQQTAPQQPPTQQFAQQQQPARPQQALPQQDAPSVEVGQTVDQVTAALGQPQAKIKAGKDKQIYVFRDLHLKVTFSGGKVVAVE